MIKEMLSVVGALLVASIYIACLNLGRIDNRAAISSKPSDREDEEYRVYSVVLRELHADQSPVILSPETSVDGGAGNRIREDLMVLNRSNSDTVSTALIDDFITRTSDPASLLNQFNLNVQVVIITKQELLSLSGSKDGWTNFLRRYPGNSLITLSRVSFDSLGKRALVYVGEQSGGRTGRGQYVLLDKESDSWVIKKKLTAWVS